jgi:hypothetical protein
MPKKGWKKSKLVKNPGDFPTTTNEHLTPGGDSYYFTIAMDGGGESGNTRCQALSSSQINYLLTPPFTLTTTYLLTFVPAVNLSSKGDVHVIYTIYLAAQKDTCHSCMIPIG